MNSEMKKIFWVMILGSMFFFVFGFLHKEGIISDLIQENHNEKHMFQVMEHNSRIHHHNH